MWTIEQAPALWGLVSCRPFAEETLVLSILFKGVFADSLQLTYLTMMNTSEYEGACFG